MVSFHSSSGGGQMRVIIDPDPHRFARQLDKEVGNQLKKDIGRTHKRLGDKPVDEIKKRADALGSGRVRIGRASKSSATARALTVRAGGAAYPDFAGQEYGSLQYRRFLPWSGNGDDAGYVIGDILRDDRWMTDFGEEYVDAITDLFNRVMDEPAWTKVSDVAVPVEIFGQHI